MFRRFFSTAAHNTHAFGKNSLWHYYHALPSFATLLPKFQAQGLFLKIQPVSFGMTNITKYLDQSALMAKPATLLNRPNSIPISKLTTVNPKAFLYGSLICDVLNNRLAKLNYEHGLPEKENVSEREHAMQAAKIGHEIGLSTVSVLTLLTHDIGRTIVASEVDAHGNHHEMGNSILKPLNLPLNFSWYHGFAKYILFSFCEPYQDLISPLSKLSLNIQAKTFAPQIAALEILPSEKLAEFIYQICLFRLIDDMSKVPAYLLQPTSITKPVFLEDIEIQNMIQIACKRAATINPAFWEELEEAISLLKAGKDFSSNPELYDITERRFVK